MIVSQENARRKATKRYADTLSAAGVDQEFVERKGGASTSASMRTADDSDDDDVTARRSHLSSSPTSKRYTDTFEPSDNEAELEAD